MGEPRAKVALKGPPSGHVLADLDSVVYRGVGVTVRARAA